MREKRVYLRFSSGSGHYLTGEVGLKYNGDQNHRNPDNRDLIISPLESSSLSIEKNKIFLPFWHDAKMPAGTKVLTVDYEGSNTLTIVPHIPEINRYYNRMPFFRMKLEEIKRNTDAEGGSEILFSKGRITRGVIIPYNSFSIQPISLLDDPRVSDDVKDRLRDIGTVF
ncbi:hypothetical protein J4416_02415 [Candidatus Pacearchaeota archaeon]|nr:hypothetical protein [Candidatus Pacearchaeota archaeon]